MLLQSHCHGTKIIPWKFLNFVIFELHHFLNNVFSLLKFNALRKIIFLILILYALLVNIHFFSWKRMIIQTTITSSYFRKTFNYAIYNIYNNRILFTCNPCSLLWRKKYPPIGFHLRVIAMNFMKCTNYNANTLQNKTIVL